MAKEFIPTIRKRVSGADRAKEKRVDVRWLKPEIPLEGVAPSHPEGIIQSHRESIANILVRKGLVEIVEIPKVRVVKAKGKRGRAEVDAAAAANDGSKHPDNDLPE